MPDPKAIAETAKWCRHYAQFFADMLADAGSANQSVHPDVQHFADRLIQRLTKAGLGELVGEVNPRRWSSLRRAIQFLSKWAIKLDNLTVCNTRTGSRDTNTDLTKKQAQALEIIEAEGPIAGKVLAKRLRVQPATLRRHILPPLKSLGVVNNRDGRGYYQSQ